jgi:CubicO group peptidase (beta-lactamase class C family)
MTQSPDEQSQLLAPTRRALLHRVATGQADGRLPSLVAAVVRDGALVWLGARGTVDGAQPTAQTQYRIGSVTKTFVAVAVMRLRDEGRLRLGDPLDDHLPGTSVGAVRVGELLSHTAGLEAEPPGPWWERTPGDLRPALADVLGGEVHPAGRRFHYSNVGFAVLGALVAQVRGRPWHDVVRAEILDPLGLSRTSVAPRPPHATGWAVHPWADLLLPEPAHDAGLMAPAGQFWSTAEDLGRFAAFLNRGASEVLSADSLQEMREPAAPSESGEPAAGYGLGLQLAWSPERMLYGHGGSVPGFIAGLWMSDNGVGAVALANATSGHPMGSLAADLIAIVEEHEPTIPREWRPLSGPGADLLALTGVWYWGTTAHVLRLHAGPELSLASVSGHGPPTRFRATAAGTWTGRSGWHAGETLRAVTRADGTVSHLDLGTLVFTREPYDRSAPVPGGVDADGWRPGPT